MERIVFAATITAAVGSGLIAGTFFVFSVAVMPALRRQPAAEAMAAMKRINDVILNAAFLGVFVGTALICVGLAIWTFFNWDRSCSVFLLSGCLLYVFGTFGITIAFNVPRNNTLAGSDDPDAWENYAGPWTFWNHVRAAAATAATAAFAVAGSCPGGS